MKKNNSLFRYGLAFIVLVYALFHLWLLPLFPFPWFDEVFFASITESFLQEGSFVPGNASIAFKGDESLVYGPVYFVLTSIPVKIFGLGMIQFRITALLFSVLAIWLTNRILVLNGTTGRGLAALTILLALDPFFIYNAHRARMEPVALSFILLALVFLYRYRQNNVPISAFIWSGLFGALALLTTPRSGILLAGMLPLLISSLRQQNTWKHLFVWLAPFILLCSGWILYAFGSPTALLNHYIEFSEGHGGTNTTYLGGNFYIPPHEYLLIATGVFALILVLVHKPKKLLNPLPLTCILTLVLYYLVVHDWGPYSTFIIPYYYLLISQAFSLKKPALRYAFNIALGILLLFNAGYWTIKGAQVISSLPKRNYKRLYNFTQEQLPAGSKVVGPPSLYYAVKQAGCRYQLYNKYVNLETREKLHRREYQYDYLITNRAGQQLHQGVIEHYKDHSKLKEKGRLKMKEANYIIPQKFMPLYRQPPHYDVILYKREKEH